MKFYKNIMYLVCGLAFFSSGFAQTNEKATTTIVQFSNGQLYGKWNNGNWLKLNDGGYTTKPLKHSKHRSYNKSNEGKWVVSDSSLDYKFTHALFPSRMAHYKDSSVIVAGDAITQPSQIFINRSTDRGESWHRIYQEEAATAGFNFFQIQHPTLSRIVAISSKWAKDSLDNYRKAYFLMNSNDTAASWAINDSIMGIYDIPEGLDFNGKYGAFRAITPDGSVLFYSEDYGDSWTEYPLPADLTYAYSIKVLSKGSILVMDQFSDNKLGYTTDITTGNWQYVNLPDTFSGQNTYIRNKDTIWSATGVIIPESINFKRNIIVSTTDGGQSWQKPLDVLESDLSQRFGLFNIDFATPNYGVALGTHVSYLTEDGGQTWENMGLYDTLWMAPQVSFYYYNPNTEKRLLMSLLNQHYIMKYEFEEPTFLNELQDIKSQLKVYPNPAKNILFLELPKELVINNGIITVLSIEGKVVGSFSLKNSNNGRYEISINNLPQGVFILQLRSNNYVGSKLFVKQ